MMFSNSWEVYDCPNARKRIEPASDFMVPPGISADQRRIACATSDSDKLYSRNRSSGISIATSKSRPPKIEAKVTSGKAVISSLMSSARYFIAVSSKLPETATRKACIRRSTFEITGRSLFRGNVEILSTASFISSVNSAISKSTCT